MNIELTEDDRITLIDLISQKIQHNRNLIDNMVGTLYPNILSAEIDIYKELKLKFKLIKG